MGLVITWSATTLFPTEINFRYTTPPPHIEPTQLLGTPSRHYGNADFYRSLSGVKRDGEMPQALQECAA